MNRFDHFAIINQAVDEHLSFCQLKGLDFDCKQVIDFIQHLIDSSAQKPADAGEENPAQQSPSRHSQQEDKEPEWHVDSGVHR